MKSPQVKLSFDYWPDKRYNKILRALDLGFNSEGEGVAMRQELVITYKPGEKITKARIKKAVDALKQSIEETGGEILGEVTAEIVPEKMIL